MIAGSDIARRIDPTTFERDPHMTSRMLARAPPAVTAPLVLMPD
jgi:hypothetical protein